jgi:hypothetical protein
MSTRELEIPAFTLSASSHPCRSGLAHVEYVPNNGSSNDDTHRSHDDVGQDGATSGDSRRRGLRAHYTDVGGVVQDTAYAPIEHGPGHPAHRYGHLGYDAKRGGYVVICT